MTALARIAATAEALSARIAQLTAGLAALAVAGIVVILVFSSVQRYALARPIPATEEIAAYLFVCVSFLSIMAGLVDRRHIRLLPLWKRLSPGLQNWALLAGHVGALAVLVILIRETFDFAWSSYEFGARSYVANILEWPWMMIIPGSLVLLATSILARALGDLDRALRGVAAPEAAEADAEEGV